MPITEQEQRSRMAALTRRLGADLAAARGDEARLRALFKAASDQLLQIQIDAGQAEPGSEPAEAAVAEILRDGDGDDVPSAFEEAGASDDEYEEWGDLLADEAGY